MTQLLTLPEARAILAISERTLYRLIAAGRLRVVHPSPGTTRVTEKELAAYMASLRRAA